MSPLPRNSGYEFKTEVRTLPLDCCDLVLGVQWLTTLGPIWWDFSNLRMEFSVQGIKHVLRGATKSGCKGKENVAADALSRVSGSQLLAITMSHACHDLYDTIQLLWQSDPSLHKIITELATDPSSHPSYSYANSELRYKNKLVVGNDPAIKLKIFQWLHDSSLGGHFGRDATLHRIKSLFFWPRMTVDVQTYVRNCSICQKNKYDLATKPGLLQPSTPYEIIYGQPPPLHLPYLPGESSSAVVDRSLRKREELLDMLKFHLLRAQNRQKQAADARRSAREFQIGDYVYLKLQPYRQQSLKNRRIPHKLSPRFYGPFRVSDRVGTVAYKLELPVSAAIHNVFHNRKSGSASTSARRMTRQSGEDER
ncbi:hypothetical protein V2J09_021137 [Rumex salicifolius]